MKWLPQWPATEEQFAGDKVSDLSWAQIYDKEYHPLDINYPIGCKFAMPGEEGLDGRSVLEFFSV